tara:strand:+ start:54027 stop:54863 length:837 start_codon:yes stop_codon:yes gene_type:complete
MVEFILVMPLILGMIFLMAHVHQIQWSSQKLASCLWYAIRGNSYPAWAGPENDIQKDVEAVFPDNYDVEVSYGLGFDMIAAAALGASIMNPVNPSVPIYGRVSIEFESPYATFPFGLSGKSVGDVAFGDKIALSDDGVFVSTIISRSLAATSFQETFADQFLGFFAEIPQHFASFFTGGGQVEVDAGMAADKEEAFQNSQEENKEDEDKDSDKEEEEAEEAREQAEQTTEDFEQGLDEGREANQDAGDEENQQFEDIQGQSTDAQGDAESSVNQMLNS